MSELRKLVKHQCKIPHLEKTKKLAGDYCFFLKLAANRSARGWDEVSEKYLALAQKLFYYRPNPIANSRGVTGAVDE